MDRDIILRLAREAGAVFSADGSWHKFETQKTLECFAILVAEHEREECAKAVQVMALANPGMMYMTADQCAVVIRNRSN